MKFYTSILTNKNLPYQRSYLNINKENDFSINIDIQRVSTQSQYKSPLFKYQNENVQNEKLFPPNKESADKNLYDN